MEVDMAANFVKSTQKKRQREQSEREGPTKRQRSSEAKVPRPVRQNSRLKHTSRELWQQQQQGLLETTKSFTPQAKQRKRSYEATTPSPGADSPSRRLRPIAGTVADQETRLESIEAPVDPIHYWVKEKTWPKQYFVSNTMSHLLARKRSTASLRRKRSDSGSRAASSTIPSDQKPREEKSAQYQDPRYKTLLETKSSFMMEDKKGPKTKSRALCQSLLTRDQDVPQISRFSRDIFKLSCWRVDGKNEAKVIQDITRLIVPSAEELADYGAAKLECLVEAVNEGWNNSIPLTKTSPQPDYSVGFKREAFSEEQRKKLVPFVGDFIAGDQSYFMATYYMYFPFLTNEVKCGAAALDIADRQNAHSMTLAVRGVVELFRLVKREKEINREILAFSVSHDHRSVRLYGHYAVIDGRDVTFYRYPIHDFSFTALDGKEKWTAYKFIKNVYNIWMPTHFRRICSAIDDLPLGVDFDVPPLQQDSGISQDLESHHVSGSPNASVTQTQDEDSQSGTGVTTPDATQQGASKRQKAIE
ncbi:hypothetical protein EJ07DRAFT_179789 [Lizonia empirigonia]|nr:hypothetical protein EJ07DRAFT_179789 [Lizonia empirigonia]